MKERSEFSFVARNSRTFLSRGYGCDDVLIAPVIRPESAENQTIELLAQAYSERVGLAPGWPSATLHCGEEF